MASVLPGPRRVAVSGGTDVAVQPPADAGPGSAYADGERSGPALYGHPGLGGVGRGGLFAGGDAAHRRFRGGIAAGRADHRPLPGGSYRAAFRPVAAGTAGSLARTAFGRLNRPDSIKNDPVVVETK